jgi:hypothetical protein
MQLKTDWNDAHRAGESARVSTDLAWSEERIGIARPQIADAPKSTGTERPEDLPEAKVTAIPIGRFLELDIPPRETMLAPWLPRCGLAMIHASRGLGKTQMAVGTAWAVASGGEFLRWRCEKAWRVLFLDGEMPAADLQKRFRTVKEASQYELARPDNLRIAAADLRETGLPDLGDPKSQPFYDDVVADADLIVVDNLSTLCPSVKENDADSWVPVQTWALAQRRAGRSVLFVHHGGKSGTQRGTSRKEDVLDTVIGLRRPPDYSAEQGCRFELRFEKSRGFYGDQAEPFEAQLIGNSWCVSEIKASDDIEALKSLRAQGLSFREIAERTNLDKSTVARRLGENE